MAVQQFDISNPVLQTALEEVRAELQQFAADPQFQSKMEQIFGTKIDPAALQKTWASSNLGGFPDIEVLPSKEINGARGAFAAETNTIYLSQGLIDGEDSKTVAAVLLEEYGHYLDSQLTSSDAPGNEGEIWQPKHWEQNCVIVN